jgi:histidinol-phosphate aminotransferase
VDELERELGIKNSIKLASNENPLGPSPLAVQALGKEVMNGLNRYPDGGAFYLRTALGKHLGVAPDCVILGNGSNELLDIAVKTFMQPGDEAVMAWPSFVVYPMAVQAQGCTGVRVPLVDLRHDLQAMADAITDKTRIVFIANPNNPTGTINSAREFDAFMKRVPEGVLVVVDEAYFEYVDAPDYADSMLHFRDGRDILILRTFSKAYGLAGLRIGYGVSRPEVLAAMNRIREPFNTSTPAQAAALAALDDSDHLDKSRKTNAEGRAFLAGELTDLGLAPAPTQANFVFIPLGGGRDAGEMYNALLRQGVIVRPMGPEALRVTIGTMAENKAFITALKKIL